MRFIGIDCGLSGGIVEIDHAGNIADQQVMPTRKEGNKNKIDLKALSAYFSKVEKGHTMIVIEDPGGHAPSAAGLRSMTYSYAATEALVVAHSFDYQTVRAIEWQRHFWTKPKMPKGMKFDTKAAALNQAEQLWSGNDWTATERSRKPHDGMIDAALIAEYARTKKN
jgi:hypothetical protein